MLTRQIYFYCCHCWYFIEMHNFRSNRNFWQMQHQYFSELVRRHVRIWGQICTGCNAKIRKLGLNQMRPSNVDQNQKSDEDVPNLQVPWNIALSFYNRGLSIAECKCFNVQCSIWSCEYWPSFKRDLVLFHHPVCLSPHPTHKYFLSFTWTFYDRIASVERSDSKGGN